MNQPKSMSSVREPPLIGSFLALQKDALGFVQRVVAECGDAGAFHLGPIPGIVFNSPATVQGVLVDHADAFDKGSITLHAYGSIRNHPVLVTEGDEHRRERQALDPPFEDAHIAQFADAMTAAAETRQAGWAEGATIDFSQEARRLTLSIIGQLLFGIEGLDEKDTFSVALAEISDYLGRAVRSPLLLPLWIPTPGNRRVAAAIAFAERNIQGLLDDRRGRGTPYATDLLGAMLAARDDSATPLTDAQIRDNAIESFNAGHANIGAALAWTLYLLARHDDVAATVRREVDAALRGVPPQYSDLARLPFTLQVIREALRLYPPVYLVLPRRALRDIEIDGYHVTRGTMVLVSPFVMHRRSVAFTDPETFRPERFAPGAEAQLPRDAYLPFNDGPHNCLGSHIALLELHLVVATLMQRVRFELLPGQRVEPDPGFLLEMRDGCWVTVHRR